MYYVYMIECSDGSLYTGYTNNIVKRINTHNKGRGAKYTRSRIPCKLVYKEEYQTKHDAMAREWFIKHRLTRMEKLNLIRYNKS